MERVILQWNVQNWVTVVLMVAIGYALVGLAVSFLRGNLPEIDIGKQFIPGAAGNDD